MCFGTRLSARLLPDRIDEVGEAEQKDEEKSVEGEFGLFEQCFRFFHGFFLFDCFPENQEEVENDQGRKVDKRLKLVRECKNKITDKKENDA